MSVIKQAESPTRKVSLEVPEHLLDYITAYMEELKVSKPRAPAAKAADQYDEVLWVDDHRISKTTGEYEFHLVFKDKSTEWVKDSQCKCEWLIRQYMAGKKTVYLVCRVSSKAQSDKSTAISLEAQEKALLDALESSGVEYDRVKVIKIVGTAYKGTPDQLNSVIEAAQSGDAIYVWRVDRLSRNIKFASTLDDLNKRGVTVYSDQEKLFYNSEKKLDFLQHLLDSQKDSESTSVRVKRAFEYMRLRGDEKVGRLEYGFKYENTYRTDEEGNERIAKRIVIESQAEQDIIGLIVKDHRNKSPKDLASSLNHNRKYKRGKVWNAAMVRGILKKKGLVSYRPSKKVTPKKASGVQKKQVPAKKALVMGKAMAIAHKKK